MYCETNENNNIPYVRILRQTDIRRVVGGTLLMDCYLDVVGGLVPLRYEGATPKAVRMGVIGSG
jgi:hypothetical protein